MLRLGTAQSVVNSLVAHVTPQFIDISVPAPGARGQARAENMEKFLTGANHMIEQFTPTRREIAKHTCLHKEPIHPTTTIMPKHAWYTVCTDIFGPLPTWCWSNASSQDYQRSSSHTQPPPQLSFQRSTKSLQPTAPRRNWAQTMAHPSTRQNLQGLHGSWASATERSPPGALGQRNRRAFHEKSVEGSPDRTRRPQKLAARAHQILEGVQGHSP